MAIPKIVTEYRWSSDRELPIEYDPNEQALYRAGDPACCFHAVRWPFSGGRATFGEFPLVVAREHFRRMGYHVLASEPRLPNGEGFIFVSYPGKRRAGDPSYQRMEAFFGSRNLASLNLRADEAKREQTGNAGGGDPDLFVFRESNPRERFFVEVKHEDHLTKKQKAAFPIVEQLCPIIVARLVARSRAG